MKAAGCRSDGNAAATILIAAVLLGCLAIFAQCGRVPTGGSPGYDDDLAATAQTSCYKACGNGRCDYCCLSEYLPTFCYTTEAKCKQACHPPIRRAVPDNGGIENERP